MSWLSARAVSRRSRPSRLALTELETRVNPTSILQYHVDQLSTGVNNTETMLTRQNVNANTFGKLWQVQVQGQVYAEPLVETGVNITTGSNQGMHNVVFVATEHDQLYAYDADAATPTLLWQRSFIAPAAGDPAGTIYNTTDLLPNFTAATTVPQGDVGTGDITVEIGITGTPVIDAGNGTMYLVAKTKETVGGTAHYVQRLYAVNIQNGADKTAPYFLGDTTGTNTNYASEGADPNKASNQIWVYGTGDGSLGTDPYFNTGRSVVQFNALREAQRPALNLVNGVVYIGWASHGDNGPYHGWMVGVSAYSPSTPTMALKGVLNTTPNRGLGGIWMAGGQLTFDGTYFYFETGNGGFDGNNSGATITGLDNAGFPINGDYGDSFVKVAIDPASTPASQNRVTGSATQTVHSNGWGLKIVDYFTPFNQASLDAADQDLGSSASVVVPDYNPSGGANQFASAAHPKLLVGSGKQGVIYLIDRGGTATGVNPDVPGYTGSMGGYGKTDHALQASPNELSGSLDSAALFNGQMYYVEGYGGNAKAFTFANAAFNTTPASKSADPFSFAGSTPFISANGTSNGIVWDVDRGLNQLRAYSSDSYATELWTSDQAANGRDRLGPAVKFQVATVANGRVYVGAGTGDPGNVLVVYGLIQPPTQPPAAPSNLQAAAVSGTQINLSWTDNAVPPNIAYGFYIEQSPDGVNNWTQIADVSGTSYSVGGLNLSTTYYFRIRAHNTIGNSAYVGPVSATTTNQAASINYPSPNGFTGYPANGALTFVGGASLVSNTPPTNSYLLLTDNNGNEARAVYATNKQNIGAFTTTFTYLMNGTQGNTADGLTFVVQNDPRGLAAIGGTGGSLGYGNGNQITPSFALAFNNYAGHPYGAEFLTNGNVDFNYTQTNVNVSLVNVPISVTIIYHGGNTLTATLQQGQVSETKTFTFATDLPTLIGGSTAYVGFTAGTGGLQSTQEVTDWVFTPQSPPDVPTGVQATLTGYTAANSPANPPPPFGAHLTWTAAAGASGYKIERKATAGGTYSQVGTSNMTSFDDTGLTPGTTYYYRVRATNSVGDGAYSSEIPVVTPSLAPTPTNGQVTNLTPNSVTLQWQDNANNEDGYQILRQIGTNGFVLLANLPANANPAPSLMNYTDNTVTPGTHYDYHVIAYNLAGYSDFAGISTNTPLLNGPTNLSANPANGQIQLTWTGVSGATSYNVYRGTSPNGEGATPYATGITGTSFNDSALAYNTTYYYKVTALSGTSESGQSNEASAFFAGPPTVSSVQVSTGSAQRSEVRSITVTFSGPVSFNGAAESAFQLLHVQTGVNVGLTASVSLDGQLRTVVVLTFSGSETDPVSGLNGMSATPSLADGRYQLTIFGTQVFGTNGLGLDGAGTGTAGSNYVSPADTFGGTGLHLYRLFADANGDGVVDATDLGQFRSTFNANNTQANYLAYLDADNSGAVDASDLGQFRSRFNLNVF